MARPKGLGHGPDVPLEAGLANLRVNSSSNLSELSRGSNRDRNRKGKPRQPPWFSQVNSNHPYELMATTFSTFRATTFHSALYFPYGRSPPAFVGADESRIRSWSAIADRWCDVVALCGRDEVRLVRTSRHNPYEVLDCIRLEALERTSKGGVDQGTLPDQARALTWAMETSSLTPLLCFGGSERLLYVWDVALRRLRSCLRGHGGTIMHLTTHPLYPHIVASSSRDRSTRIMDLSIRQDYPITYKPWSDKLPNKGNFPLGGEPAEGEGDGSGRCVVVVGGWVNGHRDAVVGAEFHPTLPLIATCGLDQAVKIWPLSRLPVSQDGLPYEMVTISDPLFSTSRLHSSPLDSIHWLLDDTLVSKSWDDQEGWRGKCIIWQWIGKDSFFPENKEVRYYPYFHPRTWHTDNSRLYREIASFPIPTSQQQYTRIGLHRPFSSPEDIDPLVSALLIAVPTCSESGEVRLWNPLLQEAVEQQRPPPSPTFEAESIEENRDGSPELGMSPPPRQPNRAQPATTNTAGRATLPGWTLSSTKLENRARWSAVIKELLETEGVGLRAAAVSPAGARWIVGAGEGGLVLVWGMKG